MKQYFLTLLLLCFINSTISYGQNVSFGLGIGASTYWGDLNGPDFNTNYRKNSGFALQIFGRKYMSEYFAVKGNLLISRIKGDDQNSSLQWQKERNLNFRSVLNEVSVAGEIYPFKFGLQNEESVFSPFVTLGMGAFYFNPTTTYLGNTFALQPLGTEGQGLPGYRSKYNKIALSLQFGGGIAFKLGSSTIIHLDVIGRRTTTDYIDDISGSYVNYEELRAGNGDLAARLADRTNEYLGMTEPLMRETGVQRGGALVKDYFFTTMVSAAFRFGKGFNGGSRKKSRVICPSF